MNKKLDACLYDKEFEHDVANKLDRAYEVVDQLGTGTFGKVRWRCGPLRGHSDRPWLLSGG